MKRLVLAGLPACAATAATATRLNTNTSLLLFICRSSPVVRLRSTVGVFSLYQSSCHAGGGLQVVEVSRVGPATCRRRVVKVRAYGMAASH